MMSDKPTGGSTLSITHEELGRRLKAVRESVELTQREVSEKTDIGRSALSDIENGKRRVDSVELEALAELYGVRVSDFFEETVVDTSSIVAKFRSDPDLADDETLDEAVRRFVRLCSTLAELESELDQAPEGSLELYGQPPLASKKAAVQQARQLARTERSRLDLESQPISNIAELVNNQGVRVGDHELPNEISGLFFRHPEAGPFIIVNQSHATVRRRFSVAHEYCHALFDHSEDAIVSRTGETGLREARANSFAAHFLMPPQGVRELIDDTSDGDGIDVFDAAHVAQHFGTSYDAAVYHLHNLQIIDWRRRDELRDRYPAAKRLSREVWGNPWDQREGKSPLSAWILDVALSAYKAHHISRGKLEELAEEAGVSSELAVELLLEESEPVEPAQPV